jgi:hypothetical protein
MLANRPIDVRVRETTMSETLGDTPAGAAPALAKLVGTWTTEATHPEFPGTVVRGRSEIEWLEGERFLIVRARLDHPEFPDAISIIGDTDGLRMHYFDSRGVHRIYETSISDDSWDIRRDSSEFSQRMRHTFEDDGNTMVGVSQLSRDGKTWDDDLEVTYRRER